MGREEEEAPPEETPTEEVDAGLGRELEEIRKRRTGDVGRRFPSAIEDVVLIGGVVYGIFFAVLLFSMSGGAFGTSTWMDHTASKTVLDPRGECEEVTDEPWIHIYPDNDYERISIGAYNLPQGTAGIVLQLIQHNEGDHQALVYNIEDEINVDATGHMATHLDFSDLHPGEFELKVLIDNVSSITTDDTGEEIRTLAEGDWPLLNTLEVEVQSVSPGLAFLPFVDDEEHMEATILEAGTRTCWTMRELGNWGFVLMGAELGGGRETAMLTGGAAGIPAWWMAFISLSLSVVSLMLLYPLMYKVYHQETDDMLSNKHIEHVATETIRRVAAHLAISVDWELFKVESRELSIDIMVPYKTTQDTLSDTKDVRAEVLRELLGEFAIFRVFKPVQLTVRAIDQQGGVDLDTGIGFGGSTAAADGPSERQDYTAFFNELHTLARVEEDVRDSLDLFFVRNSNIKMEGAVVTSDDRLIFVSVVYRPTLRLAFFRFKTTTNEVEQDLRAFIQERNGDLLDTQDLIVKVRNQVHTLADRSGAGRVEHSTSDDERVAAVARQDGLGGRVLQTKFLGDLLSTVEYTANEKREFINRWGFWGLIVFVWIPFMASGVIVGSMLGMLSRMKFMRVLWAVLIGGSAASVTWAYTADRIIRFMHAYKLEAMIPIAIFVFVLIAYLHMRSTRLRRQAELFEDTLLDNFHADVHAKYGEV